MGSCGADRSQWAAGESCRPDGSPILLNQLRTVAQWRYRGVTQTLRSAIPVLIAQGRGSGPLRAGAISVANPVDTRTDHIIAMPDSPFPEGELPLDELLTDLVDVPLVVDNDVNLMPAPSPC